MYTHGLHALLRTCEPSSFLATRIRNQSQCLYFVDCSLQTVAGGLRRRIAVRGPRADRKLHPATRALLRDRLGDHGRCPSRRQPAADCVWSPCGSPFHGSIRPLSVGDQQHHCSAVFDPYAAENRTVSHQIRRYIQGGPEK